MPTPTGFTEWGYLGALLFLVIAFIWYIDRRDRTWQDFTRSQRAEDNSVIRNLISEVKDLATQLVALRDDFNEHNTWEREALRKLDENSAANEPKTGRRRT